MVGPAADPRDADIARLAAKLATAQAMTAKPKRPRTIKAAPKLKLAEPLVETAPVVVLPPPQQAAMTMAELLRSYGHVR